jgi:2-methylcitrate dehydratase PrpD
MAGGATRSRGGRRLRMSATSVRDPANLTGLADMLASWPDKCGDASLARARIADACLAYQATADCPLAEPASEPGDAQTGSPSPELVARAMASRIRYSEIDDILLSSCITPGSVVVPALFAIARLRPSAEVGLVAAAASAGYAVLGFCGELLDGASALARGQWPSRAAAALGAAATACVLMELDADTCRHALALAATFAWHGRPDEPGREILFGWAVGAGVQCARLAASGVTGDIATLQRWPFGVDAGGGAIRGTAVTAVDENAISAARIKPLCCARQALPAAATALALLADHPTRPGDITGIDVWLPGPCRTFVDRPVPRTRLDSIASIQYQLAAALYDPAVLWDIERAGLPLIPQARAVAAIVRLHGDPELTRAYPRRWPARVLVETRTGSHDRLEPDLPEASAQALATVERKIARLYQPGSSRETTAGQMIAVCRQFCLAGDLLEIPAAIDRTCATAPPH